MELTERERGIWRAAITLANNICVQECDRINDDDGSMEAIDATNECAKRIREWAEPSDDQLAEMFGEAGVPQGQATEGEEIMVSTPHDVFTLPLRPSRLSSGPRFVVHVPGPEQTAAVDGLATRLVDELDGLVSESVGVSGLHLNGDVAPWEELLPGGRFECLSSLDELREALATQQQEPTT